MRKDMTPGDAFDRSGICALCHKSVHISAMTRHWQIACEGTLRPQINVARRYAQAEPPLLERVWEQIEDIMVDTGFVR